MIRINFCIFIIFKSLLFNTHNITTFKCFANKTLLINQIVLCFYLLFMLITVTKSFKTCVTTLAKYMKFIFVLLVNHTIQL